MADPSIRFVSSDYWLGPGPLTFDEPMYSFEVFEIEEYKPASIAAAILSVPGAREFRAASPSWWEWECVWSQGGREILMDDVYISEETGCWMQLHLTCDCLLADVLAIWAAVRVHHPAVWMFGDDSLVYSPESFTAKWTA